ncbi:hypothetical protein D3C81_2288340 [compost metagenome]
MHFHLVLLEQATLLGRGEGQLIDDILDAIDRHRDRAGLVAVGLRIGRPGQGDDTADGVDADLQ